MPERPAHIIVGKGRWGTRMHAMLSGEGVAVSFAASARQDAQETSAEYEARMSASFQSSGAQIAWLCTPPGPHVPQLIRAALNSNLHVLVEKPWTYSREETFELQRQATSKDRQVGVHFEFCFLSEVERWRAEYAHQPDLTFGGTFTVSAPDRLGISALENLGSHLLAIKAYAVANARLSEIHCGYGMSDKRTLWLERDGKRVATIDFFGSQEPIIQRFLARFESSLGGERFPFDTEFALSVNESLELLSKENRVAPGQSNQKI